jgi:hypothetical protein
MATVAKHTTGPVIASGRIRSVSGDRLYCGAVEPSVAIGGYRGTIANTQSAAHIGGISNDEAKANTDLIAEAFNVAHETGLTPRQLAERCVELEAAISEVAAIWNRTDLPNGGDAKLMYLAVSAKIGGARPFYGAECPPYPNCNGGCGCGCTHEIEAAKAQEGGA